MGSLEELEAMPGIIGGPITRQGCGLDWNAQELIAYSSSNVITFVDESSMQVTHSLASPYCKDGMITALRFDPEGSRLASGDRMGRIALWDIVSQRVTSWIISERNVGWIRDLKWVSDRPWLLVALYSTSLVTVYDPATRKQLWRFEYSPETLISLSCDPFDARKFAVIGSKGFLGSLLITGRKENESSFLVLQIPLPEVRTEQTDSSASSNSKALGSGNFPDRIIKFDFAPGIRDCLYILLARQFLTYDLQYSIVSSVNVLPRGHAKMINFFAQTFGDTVFCLHADGKVTVWKRKFNSPLYIISHMESLMPSIATSSPTPQILDFKIKPQSQYFPTTMKDATIENSKISKTSSFNAHGINLFIISLSDDNKLWHWIVHVTLKTNLSQITNMSSSFTEITNRTTKDKSSNDIQLDFSFELIGNMFGISSSITTLSTPTPLLLPNKLGVGVSKGASLLALATQNGSVDIMDPVSNCIISSFSLHSSMVRGVRFLSNSKVVSFSFTEIKGKNGGFINSLFVICLKSGQSSPFRLLSQPESSSIKGLRTSSSGRYLIILFRDSPAEVWAMTKTPQLLRSIALPFTTLEWSIPELTFPEKSNSSTNSNINQIPKNSGTFFVEDESKEKVDSSEFSESFAFALVNGSLGVFEIRNHRVRDFRPVWPNVSFISVDVLITSMAYRIPYVVLGDKLGNVKVWNVRNGQSFTFSTSKTAIRRIRFCPVVSHHRSRGRVSLLFADRSFSMLDLDSGQLIPHTISEHSNLSLSILEFDWLPLQGKVNAGQTSSQQILCITVIDGSLRLIEVHGGIPTKGERVSSSSISFFDRYHPSPISSLSLHPMSLKLALKLILQIGVKSSWFTLNDKNAKVTEDKKVHQGKEVERDSENNSENLSNDFRIFLFDSPFLSIGESSVFEILLKSLSSSSSSGNLMNMDDIQNYSKVSSHGVPSRCKFVSSFFGEIKQSHFWSILPNSLSLLSQGSAGDYIFFKKKTKDFESSTQNNININKNSNNSNYNNNIDNNNTDEVNFKSNSENIKSNDSNFEITNLPFANKTKNNFVPQSSQVNLLTEVQDWGDSMEIQSSALQKIKCHSILPQDVSVEKRAHEFVTVGDYESAVTLFLSSPSPTSPSSSYTFFMDSLRAITLASSVSPAMHELAIKVVAANMASCSQPLCAIHLLCSVGKYNEACSQLQDLGYWIDASTIAATHLNGSDKSRVLERWADYCLNTENDIWKAIELYVSAGAFLRVLNAFKKIQQPDSAFMFLLTCHEAYELAISKAKTKAKTEEKEKENVKSKAEKELVHSAAEVQGNTTKEKECELMDVDEDVFSIHGLKLPYALREQKDDVEHIIDSYVKYQFWLAHVCSAGVSELDFT